MFISVEGVERLMLKVNSYSMSFRFENQYPYNEQILTQLLKEDSLTLKTDPSILSVDPLTGAPISTLIFENKEFEVSSQNERGVLGVKSDDSINCIKGINLLINYLNTNTDLGINLEEDIKFLETVMVAIWFSKKSWHSVFSQFKPKEYNVFSDFFKEDVENYAIRISSIIPEEFHSKSIIECINFFELSLLPLNTNPKRVKVNYVYRNSNIYNVIEFNENIEEKLSDLLRSMEEVEHGG